MKGSERLKEIEGHFKRMNNFGWTEDVKWLINRVKELEGFEKLWRDFVSLQSGNASVIVEELEKSRTRVKRLTEALAQAKHIIQTWHGDAGWETYKDKSPEMKRIKALEEE